MVFYEKCLGWGCSSPSSYTGHCLALFSLGQPLVVDVDVAWLSYALATIILRVDYFPCIFGG